MEAENFLVKMRQAENALHVARAVIDASHLPSAHFQAACIMRDSVLKNWNQVPIEQRNDLKNHILRKASSKDEYPN